MTQSIAGTVANLFAACRDQVYVNTTGADGQPVLVSLGDPGQYQPFSIVAVGMEIRTPITRPTAGPTRSRNTEAEIDVTISVYVAGGEEALPVAIASAYSMQAALETFLRTSPNETLSGACRDSTVSGSRLTPVIAYQQADDPTAAPVATGRVAQLTVTVTASIRY
jgi:hypothetical protein